MALAPTVEATPEDVALALAVLGSRGLVGFSQHENGYFHRELPFALDDLDQLSRRLDSARKLLDAGGASRDSAALARKVRSDGVEERVQGVAPTARALVRRAGAHVSGLRRTGTRGVLQAEEET